MRLTLGKSAVWAAALALAGTVFAAPVLAGSRYHDRVYAESLSGNLVIHSRAGYKRIIVGAGHLAQELAEYESPNDPDVADLDEDNTGSVKRDRDCHYPGVFIKGRSYMYGLDEGEIPLLPGQC